MGKYSYSHVIAGVKTLDGVETQIIKYQLTAHACDLTHTSDKILDFFAIVKKRRLPR